MKKSSIAVVSAVLVVMGLALIAGCTSGGKSADSTGTNTAAASPGVPIYPGAEKQDTTTSATARPDGSAPSSTDNRPRPPDMQGSMPQGSMPQPPNGGPGANNQGPGGPGGMTGALAVYTTQDSVDQVISWYRDKLKDMTDFKEMTQAQAGSSAPPGQPDNTGNTAMFSVTVNGQTRTVMVRQAWSGSSSGSSTTGGTMIIIGEGVQGAPRHQQNQGSGT
jgi:hypothetical protein